MAQIIYDDIQSIDQSWENYAGSSVEKFIKKELNSKAGYIYRSSSKEGDYYYLYGFTSYEQFESWAVGDPGIVPLFKVQLPNIENDTFTVNLTTNSNTTKMVNLGEGVIINLRYTSVSTNPTTGVSVDTFNDGTLIIQRSANGSTFTEVGRVTIQPTPNADPSFREFNITPYLVDGDNKFRLRVEDSVNGSVSPTLTFNSIINTTLAIQNATSTANPLRALQFQYYIQGQVEKTLHIKITQGGSNQTFNFPLGTNTYIEVPYTTPVITMDVVTGIVEVEAWLSVDDTTVVSYSEVNQFYYSDGSVNTTVIILNEVNTNVINYTNQHLFDMTLYNKSDDVEVTIKSQDGNTDYLTLTFNNCQTGVVYPVYATLELDSNADSIPAMVTVESNEFNCTPYSINIDNTEKMSPVTGATFVLNPKIRNNSEENPNTIINSVTGNTVSSTFSGFGFLNDGWMSDDNNIGVLRIPSEHTLTINYDPLNNLTNGTSIELDYKVYNIFNDSDEVVKMYTTNENDDILGFVMNATEAAFYTAENQTKRDQDVIFQEGVRTHMVINIIPNLSNSGLNYIRIFVNGILNREMLYSGTDVFKSGVVSMIFGSQNCDIDIYGIRIYKQSLSASDIRQNYMSSLPTIEEKIAFKDANNILSANGTISYDRARVKYNTLVWTGQVPSYSTGNREYQGKLQINILGDKAHSGIITNLKIKGQGSSSRGYWKWNHQYDWNKLSEDSVWTDDNGTIHRDGYTLTDNDPAAVKLVAKLNWASSMQSHKIGSTAMYTDLWRTIVGGNSITKTAGYEKVRVSVHEKPFLYFVKDSENAQPVFYGLMTFGSGKYDKPTFGYDKNVFPDYLILEGSDNGMPLTLRQVPWFSDEVTYNTEEEYYEYAGQGNLDYGMGKQENIYYFQDAFNFTYLHSPFLTSFTGSISADADKKYQYWDTVTKNVFRYDYISQDWVNAGITKTNGEYDVLNLEIQSGLNRSSYSTDAEYTAAVIAWRKTDFKNRIGVYYNTTDVLFSMAILKLIGASDNWCKNTYEYLDPVTHKICLAQDDMDTLMLTDNVGRKTKPYYVEEHDLDPDGKPYFNGSDNIFFNLMEMAFDAEEKAMMKQILTAMVNQYESVSDCIQHYFFNVQEYFPAVAYNEVARLLYEEASVKQSQGIYVNGTPAISQSLGDQLQAERQWWKRRIPYMQSWSSTDPFYTRSTTEPNLQFRSMTTTINTNPEYSFALKPWQYLYPKVGTGQYLSYDSTRVPAGTVYNTVTMSTDGNTDTFIYGSNYYTSYGEFGGVSLSETFNLVGDRLLEFSADSRQVARYDFRPTRMTVNCPELRSLTLYGCSTLSGSLDLSNSLKLETLDLRNTGATSLILPESDKLEYAYLPDLTSLYLVNVPNLTYTIAGYTNMVNLTTDNSTLALDVMENASNIGSLTLYGVNITTDNTNAEAVYNVLADPDVQCSITGHIYLDMNITQAQKTALENKFGTSIWNSESDFYITFIVTDIQSVTLSASKTTLGNNDSCTINAVWSGNNDQSYSWTVSDNTLAVIESKTSIQIFTDTINTAREITVTYTLNKTDGNSLTATQTITLMPFTFYIDGTSISSYVYSDMVYGSGDSSVTDSVNLPVTCSDNSKEFSITSITSTKGSATYSGNNITSLTVNNFTGNKEFVVAISIDSLSLSYTFSVETTLVSLTINSIPAISALNGTGSGSATFSYTNGYGNIITMVSATVTGGNTNTVTNLTIDGCTINCSGYTTTGTRTLTVVYKVNGGSNCTATQTFNVNYVEAGPYVKATYNVTSTSNTTQLVSWQSNANLNKLMDMKIDSVSVTPVKSYTFSTTGEHIVEFEFKSSASNWSYYWFYSVTNVVSLEVSNATYIYGLFCEGCTSLKTVILHGNIQAIGKDIYGSGAGKCFYNCSSLDSIIIDSTTAPTIHSNDFQNVKNGGTLTYPAGSNYSTWLRTNSYYLGYYNWNTIETTIDGIKYQLKDNGQHQYTVSVVANNYSGDVVIPSTITYNGNSYNVTIIGNNAFLNRTELNSITLPDTLLSINKSAFSGCSGLTSIIIPSNYIADTAFQDCTGLTSITIKESVNSIGSSAFFNCSGLTSITVNSNNTVYNDGNGSNCIIETASNSLILGCKNTTIPNTVIIIGTNAYSGCSGLTSITIPNSVTDIKSSAFQNCTGLTSIIIPDSVTTISGYVFYNCYSLTSVVIGNSVTTIGSSAFSGCFELTSVNIGNSVTSMGSSVFQYCGKLSTITINLSNAPTIESNTWGTGSDTAGYNSGTTNVLYVPSDATGYDTSNWTAYLLNTSYGKFTISQTL